MAAKPKRRPIGVHPYATKQGTRWLYKCTVTIGGTKKVVLKRGFATAAAADKARHEVLAASDAGTFADPGKITVGEWLDQWLSTLQVSDGARGTYWNAVEHYLKPRLGTILLGKLTSTQIDKAYRELETTGGRYGRGLAPRSVWLAHGVLRQALQAAVDAEPPLLARNPARKAHPPKAADTGAIKAWTPEQLDAFLDWADEHDPGYAPQWRLMAATGLRRGEALGLEWRDLKGDLLSVERNVTPTGPQGLPKLGPLKNKRPRAVSLDKATVKLLKSWKARRGSLALQLVRPDAPIFADENGIRVPPKLVTGAFNRAVYRCRRDLGDDAPPRITLHGLRHTAITHWLEAGVPVTIVAERHGHTVQMMLSTYAHVLAGSQASAAQQVADFLAAWGDHSRDTPPDTSHPETGLPPATTDAADQGEEPGQEDFPGTGLSTDAA